MNVQFDGGLVPTHLDSCEGERRREIGLEGGGYFKSSAVSFPTAPLHSLVKTHDRLYLEKGVGLNFVFFPLPDTSSDCVSWLSLLDTAGWHAWCCACLLSHPNRTTNGSHGWVMAMADNIIHLLANFRNLNETFSMWRYWVVIAHSLGGLVNLQLSVSSWSIYEASVSK